MYCPRLDHFVRFNPNGTVSRCGHMVNAPRFDTVELMEGSSWLGNMRKQMQADQWPRECQRCQQTEQEHQQSIRLHAIQMHDNTHTADYLQVGGILDNVCNAACLMCDEQLSTRIGSLRGRKFPVVDNMDRFWSLPQERIVHLDINGGEPSYSKNYRQLLSRLPPNLQTLRVNTNCSTVLPELNDIAQQGIEVTVTVSCDGIGAVHELVRWPLTWQNFYDNLMQYKMMPVKLNLWTTVSVLNVDDLPTIQAFAQQHGIDHDYAYLEDPAALSVHNTDVEARERYILVQKQLRGID
jgi:sulfatase maturation enzyme AslB (radical SAM superfamily)